MNLSIIKSRIEESTNVKTSFLHSDILLQKLEQIIQEIIKCYQTNHKVLWCGNGGSAADAQHLAAELSGRYYFDRPPLFSEALHTNSSYLTAVANDYGYNMVYSRLVEAMGNKGDILMALSTSGNSENILEAIETANKKGIIVVGLTGQHGGKMKDLCQYIIQIPSTDTPRIQECHMLIGHIICEMTEKILFQKE